ncbi:sugar-binding transcriptional regulator [Bombilactobacillus thymidiniphilus]|uniref:Sugar-binding domain-containing protein n=1 Tax=Bombilactobacillus thymidiniphilus TaxID=2923363 RepID=A0ABY4PFL2_9LACO|nr:sugar-binding domain-containing protein [Bombilactobacillus thymidiniphilus]UQS84375.1 sugar-binding domain-containing protein [Bombilactobacillus thymidiniphilus]
MSNKLGWIEAVAPDFLNTLRNRYRILQNLQWLQPIGRRVLATELDVSERVLRRETDLFKKNGLIDSSKSGMMLTYKGTELVRILDMIMGELNDNSVTEQRLATLLNIQTVIVVPGDSAHYQRVMDSMGNQLNRLLDKILPAGFSTIAVMGGTTMSAVAQYLTPDLSNQRNLLFVPARGGLGETVSIQANSVCAEMAHHSDGHYRALYVPEDASAESIQPLLHEPVVKSVLDLIHKSNTVIHSIGRAKTMANRREMSSKTIALLEEKKAVSEAFGTFLDQQGNIVYKIPKIGLQVSDLTNISHVVAIAGGAGKADAICSYMKIAPHQTILITDEAASEAILRDNSL